MGFRPTEEELVDLVNEIDEDGSGQIEFPEFCQLCATFLVEDPDLETMKKELKDAFRIYDKDQQGYITTGWHSTETLTFVFSTKISADTLKEILREIDNKLSEEDLDGIIEEVDEDGWGTLDFDGKSL